MVLLRRSVATPLCCRPRAAPCLPGYCPPGPPPSPFSPSPFPAQPRSAASGNNPSCCATTRTPCWSTCADAVHWPPVSSPPHAPGPPGWWIADSSPLTTMEWQMAHILGGSGRGNATRHASLPAKIALSRLIALQTGVCNAIMRPSTPQPECLAPRSQQCVTGHPNP